MAAQDIVSLLLPSQVGSSSSFLNTSTIIALSVFFALLCACIIIGHLLHENRWANESITALLLVRCWKFQSLCSNALKSLPGQFNFGVLLGLILLRLIWCAADCDCRGYVPAWSCCWWAKGRVLRFWVSVRICSSCTCSHRSSSMPGTLSHLSPWLEAYWNINNKQEFSDITYCHSGFALPQFRSQLNP